ISFTRIITPVLLIAVGLSILGFVINNTIVPKANNQTVKIQLDLMNRSLPPVKEKVFSDVGSQRYFYVEKVNPEKGVFENVFLLHKSKPGFPQVINAKSAYRDKGKWILNDGILRKYG